MMKDRISGFPTFLCGRGRSAGSILTRAIRSGAGSISAEAVHCGTIAENVGTCMTQAALRYLPTATREFDNGVGAGQTVGQPRGYSARIPVVLARGSGDTGGGADEGRVL